MEIETKNCPICSRQMDTDYKIKYLDYSCLSDDHAYLMRFVENAFSKNIERTKIRIRLGKMQDKHYLLKINFDEGYSEIWSSVGTTSGKDLNKRIKIEKTWNPDVSNLEKLTNKIKMYLTFS
jgi:hypothetical protein